MQQGRPFEVDQKAAPVLVRIGCGVDEAEHHLQDGAEEIRRDKMYSGREVPGRSRSWSGLCGCTGMKTLLAFRLLAVEHAMIGIRTAGPGGVKEFQSLVMAPGVLPVGSATALHGTAATGVRMADVCREFASAIFAFGYNCITFCHGYSPHSGEWSTV